MIRDEINRCHACSADRSSKATLLLTVVDLIQVVCKGFMGVSGWNSHEDGSTARRHILSRVTLTP